MLTATSARAAPRIPVRLGSLTRLAIAAPAATKQGVARSLSGWLGAAGSAPSVAAPTSSPAAGVAGSLGINNGWRVQNLRTHNCRPVEASHLGAQLLRHMIGVDTISDDLRP